MSVASTLAFKLVVCNVHIVMILPRVDRAIDNGTPIVLDVSTIQTNLP
ncbi:unnamed protein product, partial [Rotaria magnacalcarata]